jgi:hypothetical protein
MKKFVILVFVLFANNILYSQFYLGGNLEQTKKMILENEKDVKINIDKDNNLSFIDYERQTAFKILFNEKGISDNNVMIPFNQEILYKWVRGFNKQFISKSDDQWVGYIGGQKVKVIMEYFQDHYIFIAYIEKD